MCALPVCLLALHSHLMSGGPNQGCSLVSDAPRNLQVSIFTESQKGTVAVFQCSVDSNPPASWALYKGGALLATSKKEDEPASHRISVTTGANALRVEMTGVVPEDEGSYNVTAINAHGATSRQLYFRVQSEGFVSHS